MKVIALKEGYFGKLRMPGDEFDAPEGSKASWFVPVQTAISAPPASQVPDGLPAFLRPGGGGPQNDSGDVVPLLPADSSQASAEAPPSHALPEAAKVVSEVTKVVSDTAPPEGKPADDAPPASHDDTAADDENKDADAKPAAKPAPKRTRAAASASGGNAA